MALDKLTIDIGWSDYDDEGYNDKTKSKSKIYENSSEIIFPYYPQLRLSVKEKTT